VKEYDQVINYLYDHLPYYQRSGPAAYKDNLDNTLALDKIYGHPHKRFRSVHVAGTNGKGSVSHMLASVLMEAGFKTGLYTSPHLKDYRERIRVNGEMIRKEFIVEFINDFLNRNKATLLEPSFFELSVMMAFEYFARENVDVAVIEVGLGGRLDSTNIITPVLSVITNISYDHTALLGDTLGKIALEKAGIIKKSVPVVIGETHPETEIIFKGVAKTLHAPLLFADTLFKADKSAYTNNGKQVFSVSRSGVEVFKNLHLDLLGKYQSKNICTLLAAVEELKQLGWNISEHAIRKGLESVTINTGLLGRWQLLGEKPLIICDTAHNEGGIREVVAQLKETPHKQLHIVFGVVKDKDINTMLKLLPANAQYYFTKAAIPRALDEKELMRRAAFFNLKGKSYSTVKKAFEAARKKSNPDDLIIILGSTFVVAEVLTI
jgi:dihydrofolate synthase / folylpolyglutamate synthase